MSTKRKAKGLFNRACEWYFRRLAITEFKVGLMLTREMKDKLNKSLRDGFNFADLQTVHSGDEVKKAYYAGMREGIRWTHKNVFDVVNTVQQVVKQHRRRI